MELLQKFPVIFVAILTSIRAEEEAFDLSFLGENLFASPDMKVGNMLNEKSVNEMQENPEEVGSYVQGDLLVPRSAGKNGMKQEYYRWQDGVVPYEIAGRFNSREMELIRKAIAAYHKNTCIQFVPRRGTEPDYLSIESEQSGCWSSVGRIGGKQQINLQNPGCVSKVGTVIHEMMHALGFLHEQNREERDDYVTIQSRNIKPGYENNFDKAPVGLTSGQGVTYDYGSVMHYSAHAFSSNGNPTITSKTSGGESQMGQRENFSNKDIQKINTMYKCKGGGNGGATTARPTTRPSGSTKNPIENFLGIFTNSDKEEMLRDGK